MSHTQGKTNRSNAKAEKVHAYTPGLKVKQETTLRRSRTLPISGDVLVKEGNKVEFDTVIARMRIPGDPNIVKVALILRVEPNEIEKYMLKKVGEKVKSGESIAQYTALFGIVKRTVTSPIDGVIENIGSSGWVTIRSPPVTVDLKAYIPGKVIEVIPSRGVVIETNAAIIQGIFGIGGENYGIINMAVSSPDETLNPDKITPKNKGEILVGGSFASLEALRKAKECGVAGIVVGGIDGNDLTKLLGYEMGVAITGEEEIGVTLIITEGFGKMTMSLRTYELFKKFKGMSASISGVTQIRAGVIRPEIIIPHDPVEGKEADEELSSGMTPGTAIRIIRQPHFGSIGKIVSFPVELKTSKTESRVRVVDVELEEGGRVLVPRANVEIIET